MQKYVVQSHKFMFWEHETYLQYNMHLTAYIYSTTVNTYNL